MATAEHKAKHGALCTGTRPMKFNLYPRIIVIANMYRVLTMYQAPHKSMDFNSYTNL